MAYTFTEKKRIRKSFSSQSSSEPVPNLLEIQKASYRSCYKRVSRRSSELIRDCKRLSNRFSQSRVITALRRWTSSAIV